MCSCGSKRTGGTTWKVTFTNGTTKTYSSETDARIAAASDSGARVKRA